MGFGSCTDTKTPYIDNLAQNEGLILKHNYVSKICSPSRSAFISGRYPSTLGLQNLVFNVQYDVALTRQVSILSEEFKANGYNTHMIGYGTYLHVLSLGYLSIAKSCILKCGIHCILLHENVRERDCVLLCDYLVNGISDTRRGSTRQHIEALILSTDFMAECNIISVIWSV